MHSPIDAPLIPLSSSLLWLVLLWSGVCWTQAELCPPLFGEFECPLNYECTIHGQCVSNRTRDSNSQQPTSCANVRCGEESRCVSGGKCLPLQGLPCDRNTLVGKSVARAIRSDCGRRGKCVNGKCTIDSKFI